MEILKRFQADRYVRQLQSGQRVSDSQLTEARTQLLAMGASAVRSLLEATKGGPATELTVDMLVRLASQDTMPAFVDGLRSPNTFVAETVTRALSASTTYDPTQLLALYADETVSRARLEAILEAQVKHIQPGTLLRVLPDLGKEARNSAIRIVDKVADQRILGELLELSKNPEWWIRMHVARLLSRLTGATAMNALAKLVRDENAAVRLEAVQGVLRTKAVEAIPALCTRLRDQDIKVQTAAIEGLVALADVSAVPHLLDALKDESEYVRRGAVEVLNEVITPEAIKDLVNALRDADWWVRARSADALGTLGGPKVVDAVLGLVKDADEFARRYAIEILNTVPDPRAVPVLIDALEDDDWWVRERAVDALGKAGDPVAVEPLLRMMGRDARALPLCVRALGAIGHDTVIEPLCRLAESTDAETRREALQALQAVGQRDLSEPARQIVIAALERAGVRLTRGPKQRMATGRGQGPLEVRGADHNTQTLGRTPAQTKTPAPQGATPTRVNMNAGEVKNFQKLAPGAELIGRFRVIQRVGGGGFGTVYLVEDLVVNEQLVLKILSQQLSLDPNMIKRFVQELKLTRRISHPNVIRIYDLIDLDGAHAISMEHFAGHDLGALLREHGPLSPARAMHIAEQTLEGLAAAHAAGILHRDIKPANLLVGDGDLVKIVDFGLASVGHSTHSRLTQSGILVGTPEYISPEQITGAEVDARCDLYSLGVVLYESMSGQQPFSGANAVNVLFQHLEATVPPLSTVAAGIPTAVNDLVMCALARMVGDRPVSALAMLEMVRAAR
ncbi:MAG TPA: HEAT repeat domain-containing protein [Methylomirabilota bacterium]|jgi:serine/threonine-protein kinase|nr:HEAT repeat domain-containing protein [Methylomirabilota bacterium]